jgi:hypothetical protein
LLKKDEVPGEWRKVHDEKQWDFQDSPNKMMVPFPKGRKMGGVRVMYGGEKNSIEGSGG